MAAVRPISVDLTEPPIGDGITSLADGSLDVSLDGNPPIPPISAGGFGDNLAAQLDATTKGQLADDVLEWVQVDRASREPWRQRLEDGLRLTGLIKTKNGVKPAFPDAADIVFPLLIQACTQFQARAIAELFPSAGPVKGYVVGESTEALEEQADRVAEFLNYQILQEDIGYFEDLDQLLMLLPIEGSQFKKSYYCPIRECVRSVLIRPERVLVPYTASNLYDAERITHVMPMSHTALLSRQLAGFYTDDDLMLPSDLSDRDDRDLVDEADDRVRSIADEDAEHILYECHCLYQLDGDPLPLPYIVTVEAETRTVLGVRRNWRELDEKQLPRQWFTHYRYLPSLGFYGAGLIHAIGDLALGVSDTVNLILDGGAWSCLQGGFKSKDARITGDVQLSPGKWIETEMTSEELSKCFYPPPYREPSPALAKMLELLIEAGQSFTSTTEAMVGDANNSGPVGTTLALIEQGSKVYSAIHKRLHKSAGEEFILRFQLNSEHLPEQYPYAIAGSSQMIMRQDFNDETVGVLPVSDPNIFSSAQRISIAQATLQLSQSAPEMYDTYQVHRRMLEAINVADPDEILPDPNMVPHSDPVSEGSYLLVGKPVRAHADEDHMAHMTVHQDQAMKFQGLPPEIAQRALAGLIAHMAEHAALAYRLEMSLLMGAPLPPIDLASKSREEMPTPLDNEIAMQAGMLIQAQQAMAMVQAAAGAMPGQSTPTGNPAGGQAGPSGASPNPLDQKQAAFDQGQAHADQGLQADMAREQLKQAASFLTKQGALDVPPETLVQVSQATGQPFEAALSLIRQQQMQGQGGSQFEQTGAVVEGAPA